MAHSRRIVTFLMYFVFIATATHSSRALDGDQPDYAAERAARAQKLTRPYGWFSLTALQWLKPGDTTLGSAADSSVVLADAPAHLATFEEKDGQVAVTAHDPSLTLRGLPLDKGSVIGTGEEDDSALASGSLRIWVIDRGGRRYLRVKDSRAAALQHFHGLRWYAPDKHYRLLARWIPNSPPYVMRVRNKIGQITPVTVPGHVEFELNGTKQTLVPMEINPDGLWFVFRDQTYRQTTDGGGRFLQTGHPSNGLDRPGAVILDFNQAVNPPCAYSPFATCPLAPEEDRLPIEVPAGEKRYED